MLRPTGIQTPSIDVKKNDYNEGEGTIGQGFKVTNERYKPKYSRLEEKMQSEFAIISNKSQEEAEGPVGQGITVRKLESKFNDPKMNMIASGLLPQKPSAGTKPGEMSVTMRVSDLQKFREYCKETGNVIHTDIRLSSKGPAELHLITARVKMEDAERIEKLDYVISFKASRIMMPL